MSYKLAHIFKLLSQYEKESTDSTAWAEYGHEEIDEFISCLTKEDWKTLEKRWSEKSASIKRLLANHIYVSKKEFAQIQMKILRDMILDEDEEVAYEALLHLIFHFITSGVWYIDEKLEENWNKESKQIKWLFISHSIKNKDRQIIRGSPLRAIHFDEKNFTFKMLTKIIQDYCKMEKIAEDESGLRYIKVDYKYFFANKPTEFIEKFIDAPLMERVKSIYQKRADWPRSINLEAFINIFSKDKINVGILAFQGDVEEHEAAFFRLGVKAERILSTEQLEKITHLVIPGGESTVMSKFLKDSEFKEELIRRAKTGTLSIFGTCAGAILLSRNVNPPEKVENLGLIDIDTDRNAYGSQLYSFEEEVEFLPEKKKIMATFIRGPKFSRNGKEVEILAYHNKQPILVRHKNILAATFHPEYLEKPIIHEYFLKM